MPERPTIAVITRTKDRPDSLQRARASVQAQSVRPAQWIVVNDGGARAGVDAAAASAREGGLDVTVIHNAENLGRAEAANVGVRAATTDAIILLDDDDVFAPEALLKLGDALASEPDAAGVVGQVWRVEQTADNSGALVERRRSIVNPERGPVKIIDLAYRNIIPVNGFLYRKRFFDEVGGYPRDLPVMEDWVFLLEVLMKADIHRIYEPVAEYFIRTDIDDPADPSANSVEAGRQQHERWEGVIRNRYLRADLEAGRIGLGFLMNPPHRLPMERINAAAEMINAAGRRNWLARFVIGFFRKR